MAKEIKVTFDDGGVYEGFASTYTLNNSITYYFSFDRDYRVQATDNTITLQEYRNAGAWYPIDIITAFEVSEISGGGSGDVTKEWVQNNFVLKSGDTMTGALKFDFGNGVVFRIEPGSITSRAQLTLNGGIILENDNKQRTFSIISTDTAASISLYRIGNYNSTIWFRGYEYGSSGNYRAIAYNFIINNDTNNAWLMSGKFQTNNDWFFKGNGYIDANFYARLTAQSDLIGVVLNGNGMQLYSDKNVTIHKYERGASNQYYTSYKSDGRNTVSSVGGQDPRYRIEGYNNFVNSIECYDKITIKTEDENTARLILSKGFINTYSSTNHRKVFIGTSIVIYDDNNKAQYQISSSRFDAYNGNAVICHDGTDTDAQAAFQYNGIRTYNYKLKTFLIDGSEGAVTIQSYISAGGTGVRINVPNGHYSLTESAGTVTGSGFYTTKNINVQTSQTTASDSRRDELTALLDLFQIVYNILDSAGIAGASAMAQYTSNVVLWIYDNQDGVLKPTVTKIRNLIHN